jgi:multiple sugar transport system permease protein
MNSTSTPASSVLSTSPGRRRKSSRLSLSAKDSLFGYLFIAPQMLGYLAFVIGPIIAIFIFSLQKRSLLTGNNGWVFIKNYARLFTQDQLFYKVLGNTFIFSAGIVVLNLLLALTLALLLYRKLFAMTFFRALFFSPVVCSTVAWVLVWSFMLQDEQGTINQILSIVGINGPNWLLEPRWAMFAVIFVRVIKNVGLNMVILLAALKDIPVEFSEAARVDGAGNWQALRHITLPLLAPTIMLVVVITVIGSLNVFDHIMLLTAGGPSNSTMVLSYYVYHQAFLSSDVGYASSLAVVLFMVSLGLTILQWKLRWRWVYNEK